MREPLLILLAVLCNAGAQVALKTGSTGELSNWRGWLHPGILFGLALYGVSFVLTVRVYAVNALSVISPLMAGAIFVLISLAARLMFGEPFTLGKTAGMLLILAGIMLLSRSA
jgi:multidrug transporter EmrE-like cation transporter